MPLECGDRVIHCDLCHPEGVKRPKDLSVVRAILRFAQDDNPNTVSPYHSPAYAG